MRLSRLFLAFGFASFGSALLMFWLEPLLGKLVLPFLGGTPAVWNTCMLFYQAMLCAGYLFSHWLARRPAAVQTTVYPLLGLVALMTLPIRFEPPVATPEFPALWLLAELTIKAGLPFFVLCCASPLLQSWYTRLPDAGEPYSIYAASNLGSFLALLLFPFVIEPWIPAAAQLSWWRVGFAGLLAAFVLVALRVRKTEPAISAAGTAAPAIRASHRQQLLWIALSFAPSSLLYGTTQYLTTDVAPIPLLWVLPLALYLLTFVIAFARVGMSARLQALVARASVLAAIAWATGYKAGATEPMLLLIGVHLVALTSLSLACHLRLVRERPPAEHLTLFYLCLSIGGALAGVFHALLAPALLPDLWEYPAAVLLALVLIGTGQQIRRSDYVRIAICGALAFAFALGAGNIDPQEVASAIGIGIPLFACFLLARGSRRFALALALVLIAPNVHRDEIGERIARERGFFGVVRINRDQTGTYHEMMHGNTVHGAQAMNVVNSLEPLTYYGRSGPAGDVFRAIGERQPSIRAALVGLGTGSLAAYARPADHFAFFEINPDVERIARDTMLFTYMSRASAPIDVVIGDARLKLAATPDSAFDLIVLDAFSSDAIPVHLLTQEAFTLYLSKLRHDGWIALHVSNRYLELAPAIGDIAASLGLHGLVGRGNPDAQQRAWRLEPSTWVVIAPNSLEPLHIQNPKRWRLLTGYGRSPWSDDYSSLWRVISR